MTVGNSDSSTSVMPISSPPKVDSLVRDSETRDDKVGSNTSTTAAISRPPSSVSSAPTKSESRRDTKLPRRKPVGRRFDRGGQQPQGARGNSAMLQLMRKEAWA